MAYQYQAPVVGADESMNVSPEKWAVPRFFQGQTRRQGGITVFVPDKDEEIIGLMRSLREAPDAQAATALLREYEQSCHDRQEYARRAEALARRDLARHDLCRPTHPDRPLGLEEGIAFRQAFCEWNSQRIEIVRRQRRNSRLLDYLGARLFVVSRIWRDSRARR